MNETFRLFSVCALLPAGMATGFAQTNSSTTQDDQPGTQTSSNMLGIFFEAIHLAGDGGADADFVRNRSIEDAVPPGYWMPVTSGAAMGQMCVDT
jgi:hypothetical protein